MSFAYSQGVVFGAPNIYRAPDELRRTLGAERMDVCAFVGIAPRGPSRVPIEPESCQHKKAYVEKNRTRQRSIAVPVDSWDDYVRLYGGFDGPGRLPYAVASFFEQGGSRAYIVRIVHNYGDDKDHEGVARAEITDIKSSGELPSFVAKNEGTWGNKLRLSIAYKTHPLVLLSNSSNTELHVSPEENCPVGTLLRLTVQNMDEEGSEPSYEFRFVTSQGYKGLENSNENKRFLILNSAASTTLLHAEIVEADLLVEDGQGFREHFSQLGLSADHPRWLATVIYQESTLINPEEFWLDASLTPFNAHYFPQDTKRELIENPYLFSKGEDRYDQINHEDFFDADWSLGDNTSGNGIYALTQEQEISLLVVPDIYVPESLPEKDDIEYLASLSDAEFSPCEDVIRQDDIPESIEHDLPNLLLNPLLGNDLKEITQLQSRIVDFAKMLRRFVVLLDVPPGIQLREIIAWRSHFNSDFSASYFPWLNISSLSDNRDSLILINPSAVAAGIIARQELTFGVQHGPANALANNVVSVDEKISPKNHDLLHPQGINIFLPKRDGIWLSAARTLSRDKYYRQLSVRRLISMLIKVLNKQMQWVVFEPNNNHLRTKIKHLLNNFLRQLYIGGAFKGKDESEAFFVRCDDELNNQRILDAGQLIVEVGVAPAEPLEFIVVRITRDGDGTLSLGAGN